MAGAAGVGCAGAGTGGGGVTGRLKRCAGGLTTRGAGTFLWVSRNDVPSATPRAMTAEPTARRGLFRKRLRAVVSAFGAAARGAEEAAALTCDASSISIETDSPAVASGVV